MSLLVLSDVTPDIISPIVSNLTSIGFAVWFAVRTVTKTIPDMQKEHREERKEMMLRFEASIKELLIELKASRETHDRWKRWYLKIQDPDSNH